jgi:hypothetical protein
MRRVSRTPTCGRDLGNLGGLEARHLGAQEAHVLDDLAPAFDLGGAELARVGGVHRLPSALASWVTLARHSRGLRCGRRMAPRRGKR